MNSPPSLARSPFEMGLGREANLLDLFVLLARRKLLLAGAPLVAVVLACAASLMLEDVYVSRVEIIPPRTLRPSPADISSQLGKIVAFDASFQVRNPDQIYLTLLHSRAIGDRLADRFKLAQIYGLQSREAVLDRLRHQTLVGFSPLGLITVEVAASHPLLAARLADAYAGELQQLARNLSLGPVKNNRTALSDYLGATRDQLARSESALAGALNQRGLSDPEAAAASVLATERSLRQQISALQAAIAASGGRLTLQAPAAQRATARLQGLRQELFALENGGRAPAASSSPVQSSTAVESGMQLFRYAKHEEAMYAALSRHVETLGILEGNVTNGLFLLDRAERPSSAARPRRLLIVMGAALLALFGACAFVLMRALHQADRFQTAAAAPSVKEDRTDG